MSAAPENIGATESAVDRPLGAPAAVVTLGVPERPTGPPVRRFRLLAVAGVIGLALVAAVAVAWQGLDHHARTTSGTQHPAALSGVLLPTVVGASESLAASTLQGEGFKVAVRTTPGHGPAGNVVRETPAGDQKVPAGSQVTLDVSG